MDYHQAQPQRTGINLNISETVDAAVTLIKEAADGGADVVTVPELWFSRLVLPHRQRPEQLDSRVPPNVLYINNSLVPGSADFIRLIDSVRRNKTYANLAFSEFSANRLFVAQMLVSPTA